ncbi:MAG TPA: hypothetical protein VLT33_23430 [Labilithrix sp.]|nr:hypothetical protein [Labilithrix sp.]
MKQGARRQGWLWLALLVVWTVWIDLGRFHAGAIADAVIPVLVSLLKWTPFYWEQDRYGMLVPLLAMPIKSPFANLIVQSGCTIFAGLACFFLLARYFFDARVAPTIAAAAIGWFLAFSDPDFPYAWLSIAMFYGPALALGLGAFLLVEPNEERRPGPLRWGGALIMMVLAHWINFSIGILLLLLFAARAFGDPLRGAPSARPAASGWRGELLVRARALFNARLLLLAAGVVAGRIIMSTAPPEGRQIGGYKLLPVHDWLAAWTTALGQRDYGFGPWAAYAFAGLLVGLLVHWRAPRTRAVARPGAPLAGVAAAIVYGLVVEASLHALGGGFPGRYLAPSAAILCVLGVGLAIASVWPLLGPRAQRAAPLVVAVMTSLAVLVRFGTPSLARVHASLDERYGERTDDLDAAGCTHILGFYWQVWPSVLHAMIRFHGRGEDRILWGVGHRSIPTISLWKQVPPEKMTLCAGKDHVADAQAAARFFGLPPVSVASERATIVVLGFER